MKEGQVLIVEDDLDTRDMMSRFLELEGFRVRAAANGQQALEMLQESPNACVILLDLMMPVMDGWEFRRLQVADARLQRIPTIVVSAAPRDRVREVIADAYVSKPVDMDVLLAQIVQFCAAT